MPPKKYYRYHFDRNISLRVMQKRAKEEKQGLYVVSNPKHFFTKTGTLVHPGGEILILKGEIWGLCIEGYTIYPTKIIKRIIVPKNKKRFDNFVLNQLKIK